MMATRSSLVFDVPDPSLLIKEGKIDSHSKGPMKVTLEKPCNLLHTLGEENSCVHLPSGIGHYRPHPWLCENALVQNILNVRQIVVLVNFYYAVGAAEFLQHYATRVIDSGNIFSPIKDSLEECFIGHKSWMLDDIKRVSQGSVKASITLRGYCP